MQPAPAETIQGTIVRLLDEGYVDVAQKTIGAIVNSTTNPDGLIQQRLAELDAEVVRLTDEDVRRLSPDNAVLRALLADLDTVMGRNKSRVDAAGDDVLVSGVDAAGQLTKQLALPGMSDAQIRVVVGADWASADPDVVNRLVQYVEMPAWSDELSQYGGGVVDTVFNQALRGMAQGWNPLKVSRNIRQMTEGLPSSVANSLLRTLFLESYRTGTAIHQNANVQLIRQVVRIESLDSRICIACVYLHGDIVWHSERNAGEAIPVIQEHHQGRGTTVTDVLGTTLTVRRGEAWFGGLSSARQRALMRNDSAYDAWTAGEVRLEDFVKPYEDPVFGDMVRQASLTDMLGEGAKDWYR